MLRVWNNSRDNSDPVSPRVRLIRFRGLHCSVCSFLRLTCGCCEESFLLPATRSCASFVAVLLLLRPARRKPGKRAHGNCTARINFTNGYSHKASINVVTLSRRGGPLRQMFDNGKPDDNVNKCESRKWRQTWNMIFLMVCCWGKYHMRYWLNDVIYVI